jgi:Protein of unknown function (DUF998)
MSQQTIQPAGALAAGIPCHPALRVTRSLLGYGIIAGPIYVLVSLAQALTRDGFDLRRHAWSLLSNGQLGWIQVNNFVVTGLMTVAFAVGLRRALGPGRGSTWAPRLVAGYGVSLVGAGVFRADPAHGFPSGTPDGAAPVSWHGTLHLVSGGVGFVCLIAACLVLARRFSAQGRREWAGLSGLTGVLVLAGFAGVALGAGSAWTTVGFTATVVLAWTWVSALAAHLYRWPAPPAGN